MQADLPPDCPALIAQPPAYPSGDTEAMRRWRAQYARASECVRLDEAGWASIETVAARKREVRRVTFQDGRLIYRIPAVALEKTPDGRVTVAVSINKPRRGADAAVPEEAWLAFTRREAAALAPSPPQPPPAPGAVPPFCHGWSATLEIAAAGTPHRRELSECAGDRLDGPGFSYAFDLARLAMDQIRECAPAKTAPGAAPDRAPSPDDAVWMLIRCGGRPDPRTLDNP